MTTTTLWGICGFQSCGKDTLAAYLVEHHGFVKLSFAAALKDVVAVVFGWDRHKVEGLSKEDRAWREEVDPWWSQQLSMPNLTPRYVLQYFGTDLFRTHFHPDIWIKGVEKQLTKYPRIVITDCRFPNEIQLVRDYGGKLIHVCRDLPSWFTSYAQGNDEHEALSLHPSETAWIRETARMEKKEYRQVRNDGSLKEFYHHIDLLCLQIGNS